MEVIYCQTQRLAHILVVSDAEVTRFVVSETKTIEVHISRLDVLNDIVEYLIFKSLYEHANAMVGNCHDLYLLCVHKTKKR